MQHIPVLLYHKIGQTPPERDPYRMTMPPQMFAQQMDTLHRRGWHCLPLVDIVKAQIEKRTLPPRSFAITFDDGYRDNYTAALPILKRHGFTATIFLVADQIGGANTWDEPGGDPLMTWDEIRTMRGEGIDFGSHTRTHASLSTIPEEQAAWEIGTSKQIIEDGLGGPIALLAYPYERYTPAVQRITGQCGYLGACGSPRLPENRYNLWRRQIFGPTDTPLRFTLKLSPLWWPFQDLKRRARRMIKGR